MISLRKHLDEFEKPAVVAEASTTREDAGRGEKPADVSLTAYSRVLRAVNESGQRAVPKLGEELSRGLTAIQQSLAGSPAPAALGVASEQVEAELSRWADRAWQHHADNEREIKEIIAVVARASESLGERDKRYAVQIGDLNTRLTGLAALDDLPVIRRSILETTRTLRDCIEKMAEEGRESQRRMGSEVAEYKKRLAESERISRTDALTRLPNRRAFEQELEVRVVTKQPFSLIMMDLNDFKSVNDTWGHAAGDDLLRQFGEELRSQFTPADLVARWGGDEFAAIVAGNRWDVEGRVQGIRRWVLGEYKIDVQGHRMSVTVDAAIGSAEWNGQESGQELLVRADKGAYAGKHADRRAADRRLGS